jgi:ectoine hydroxylase-related dioxygenase (phytanoyl-CoA dioxygenase family)
MFVERIAFETHEPRIRAALEMTTLMSAMAGTVLSVAQLYARDGVAVHRGLIDCAWIGQLQPLAQMFVAAAQQEASDNGLPANLKNIWQRHDAVRRFVFESPVAAAAAAAVGSEGLSLVLDQIWAKAPQSRQRTRWHVDRPAWPVRGMMLPSVWLALTPVRAENCLEFVAGSHRIPRDAQGMDFVDYEAHRDDPDVRFLAWDLEPGDALVFHPLAYHGCRGNCANNWRLAFTTRWAGDDIRYDAARPYIDEGVSFAACRTGEPLCGDDFPKIL